MDEPGYETSLLLCQVSMAFDTEMKSVSNSEDENKSSEASCAGNSNCDANKSPIKTHSCDYPGCKAKFDRPWKLSAHRCIHTGERPYKCKTVGCTKSYTNLTHLRRHEQTAHTDNRPASPVLFPCDSPGCELKFQSKCSLKRHFLKKHDQNGEDRVKCPDCDLMFTKHDQLKSHMFNHDGIKPFKCEWCNRHFLNHKDVINHVRKHKLYKCSYINCPDGTDKIFINRSELRSHLALIHPSKFSCENCNKTFNLKCRLTSHKLSCGSDKNEKTYKCIMDDCEHMFKLHRNMLQHVKHKHGEPRFSCDVDNCGKKFIWKISYKKHIRTFHESSQEQRPPERKDDESLPKQKKRRKDAGIPKQLASELLAGVSVDKITKLEIIKKENVDSDYEHDESVEDIDSDGNVDVYDSDEECRSAATIWIKEEMRCDELQQQQNYFSTGSYADNNDDCSKSSLQSAKEDLHFQTQNEQSLADLKKEISIDKSREPSRDSGDL